MLVTAKVVLTSNIFLNSNKKAIQSYKMEKQNIFKSFLKGASGENYTLIMYTGYNKCVCEFTTTKGR